MAVVAIAVWVLAIQTLTKPAPAPPHALAWGDNVFLNKAQLQAWLRRRGIPFESWARHHAAAIRVLDPNAAPPAPAPAAKAKQPTEKARASGPTRAQGTDSRAGAGHASAPIATARGSSIVVPLLAYALVTALLLLALLPQRYVRPIHMRLNNYRSYAATAAAAIVLGYTASLIGALYLP